jgi:hypothetical protein
MQNGGKGIENLFVNMVFGNKKLNTFHVSLLGNGLNIL